MTKSLHLVAIVLWFSLFLIQSTSGQREIVSFDFGWRFRTGLTDWAAPDELPPKDTDPGRHPPEADPTYKYNPSSDWWDVQLPHDGLISNGPSQTACPDGCSGKSYIPRHVLWYRKQFSLPQEWEGTSLVTLEFEGSFRNTTVWINGNLVVNHVCGYTPFRVALDLPNFGETNQNTIAVFVDPDNGDAGGPSKGSGWWYEGGGLYRHVKLIKTQRQHLEVDSLFAKSDIQFGQRDGTALSAHLGLEVSAANAGAVDENVCVCFMVWDPDGVPIEHCAEVIQQLLPAGTSGRFSKTLRLYSPELWTSSQPKLYKVTARMVDCQNNGTLLDQVSTHHGFRKLGYDADRGFFLNKQHFKIRGFCDHDTFAVVGMAVPDRINLFRAQASRSVGGNGRRTSHNPPDPTLLDIYDRLGMVVVDENRLFGDNLDYVQNMATLVKRDRNHPSVVVWSFCNEDMCEGDNEKGGPAFQEVAQKYDGTRPTLANMFTFNDLLSKTVDIQGFSHRSRDNLDECHAAMPDKPIFMSECCSCNSMRAEDVGCETLKDNPHNACTQTSFNARCLDQLVNASDGVDYAVGTMVWTLFDYYGEPPAPGLEVSSTYGQFDMCGFPKSAAFWFRTQWLLGVPDERVDKPYHTKGSHEVHIVESWESPDTWNATRGNSTRTIHAYTNAPFIELLVNSKSQGSLPVFPMVKGGGSYAEWKNVPWEDGTLSAVAHNANGTQLATVTRQTNGKAVALVVSLDCPSKATGTGEAVLLDGQDVALVRAAVVDASGQVVHMATNNITFSIVDGPGRVQGTANGDPKSYQPHSAPWQTAFHGLVRAVVRVTSIASLPRREKKLLQIIDGPTTFANDRPSLIDCEDIVIEASSPGFQPVRLSIPTSSKSSEASVLAVAEAGAGKQVDFFGNRRPEETRSRHGHDALSYS